MRRVRLDEFFLCVCLHLFCFLLFFLTMEVFFTGFNTATMEDVIKRHFLLLSKMISTPSIFSSWFHFFWDHFLLFAVVGSGLDGCGKMAAKKKKKRKKKKRQVPLNSLIFFFPLKMPFNVVSINEPMKQ